MAVRVPPDERSRPAGGGSDEVTAKSLDTGRVPQPAGHITKAERGELAKIARLRARVARTAVAQREAELLADVEAQLSATYSFDDATWADVTAAAKAAVASADAEVARRCAELGVPAEFRPSLFLHWWDRGENAVSKRRAELRKRAQTRIAAEGLAAKAAIERVEAEVLTSIYVGALDTAAAHEFLASIPTAESLMPPMRLAELEARGAS